MFRLAIAKAVGVLEHPEMSSDPTKPSIWRLPVMRWLSALPGMTSFSFCQGLLGAPSPKPTRLLVLNMEELMPALRAHHLAADLPQTSAIGVDSNVDWKTAVLKEYPPAMSRALAVAMLSSLNCRPFDATIFLEEEFLLQCSRMDIQTFSDTMGKDFAQRG